jgi:hypothetical protein
MEFFFDNPPPQDPPNIEWSPDLNLAWLNPPPPPTPEQQQMIDDLFSPGRLDQFWDSFESWYQDQFGYPTDHDDFFVSDSILEYVFNADFVNGDPLANRVLLELLEALLNVDDFADTFEEAIEKIKEITTAENDIFDFFSLETPPDQQPPGNEDEDDIPEKEPEEKPEDVEED